MFTRSTASAIYPTYDEYVSWASGLDQLVKAIQSGNLTASRQYYAILNEQRVRRDDRTDVGSSPMTQALDQIDTALQFGDISGAQQAASALERQSRTDSAPQHGADPVQLSPAAPGQPAHAPSTRVAEVPAASEAEIAVTG